MTKTNASDGDVEKSENIDTSAYLQIMQTRRSVRDEEEAAALIEASDGEENKDGLFNIMAFLWLVLWYFFSFCTLFLNKYILATLKGDPTLLGTMQMVMTLCLGFVQMYVPCGMYKPVKREGKPPDFYRNMFLVGTCRFATVFLGLIALKYVAVSFTETVKSSAPLFTVLIARAMMGEQTGLYTQLSLIPIMSGLALCSAYELSFNIQGFVAALATNLCECLQNVYSKMLVSGKFRYTPAEMQYYTSVASMGIQVPCVLLLLDYHRVVDSWGTSMLIALLANGVFFHFQTITAYCLMAYISPVTHRPAELQFYTSAASVLVQLPAALLFLNLAGTARMLSGRMVLFLLLDGLTFHLQSFTAYLLMSYITPVTYSVANTVKRAFLIWLSVIVFGNPVTLLSGLGTVIVTVGVLLYNKARDVDAMRLQMDKYAHVTPDTSRSSRDPHVRAPVKDV